MAEHPETDISAEEEKQLIMRIITYVKKHHRVTLTQISKDLALDQTDHNYMCMALAKRMSQNDNPNHVIAFANRPESNRGEDYKEDEYQLVPTALFSYVDYLEIKEARKQAAVARRQSVTAIKIAVWSLIVSAILGIAGIIVEIIYRP